MKTLILASLLVSFGSVVGCSSADTTGSGDDSLTLCAKTACGPQLGIANYLCPDGKTEAGPTGQCVSTGTTPACHWEVISCPTQPNPPPPGPGPNPQCTASQCGPRPMIASQICSDGSTAGPVCELVNGTCGWEITTCPSTACTTVECGPQPMYAVRCADGGVATSTCTRTNGVCGWHSSCQ